MQWGGIFSGLAAMMVRDEGHAPLATSALLQSVKSQEPDHTTLHPPPHLYIYKFYIFTNFIFFNIFIGV